MPVAFVTTERMRQWESDTWASGIREEQVIERVGRRLAETLHEYTEPADRILLLAGKGHNGDDVRQCLPTLRRPGARLLNLRELKDVKAAQQWLDEPWDWVVDGLFGIGLSRPLKEDWKFLVETVNRHPARVLSVDVPSGLHADTGEILGEAIRAEITLTLGAPKPGLILNEGRRRTGRLIVEPDIGLAPVPPSGPWSWSLAEDFQQESHATPDWEAHKGSRGHVLVVGGSPSYQGAVVLAGRAAHRAGAGLVSIWTDPRVLGGVAAADPETMVHPWSFSSGLPNRVKSLLVGPGLAAPDLDPGLKEWTLHQWKHFPGAMTVDASALDWLAGCEGWVGDFPGPRVLTPHPGEAARLLGSTASRVQDDRFGAVQDLASRFPGAIVVLKGRWTLIHGQEARIRVNGTGNPGLGRGGSGDVLAGLIAGRLGQAMAGSAIHEVCRAVWDHGKAADRLDRSLPGWAISDLVSALGDLA